MRGLADSWYLRSPGIGALALLAAALSVCYAPVVFSGKTLQSPLYTVNAVIPGGPWGYTARRPGNTFDVDMATPAFYEWPLDRYIGRLLRAGELPLWNPHQGAGSPLVANYSTRVFFPYQMLLNASPIGLWDFFFLLRLWIAGALTYLFLTRCGLGWTPAVFGGVAYMLSGALVWFINLEQYANSAMVVPAWFVAVERFVQEPDARRGAWVALALGLSLLAGQPEIVLYSLVAGGLYGIVRWISSPSPSGSLRRALTWAALGVVLGFAIAAAQLLPFAAHLSASVHLHAAGGDMGVRDPAPTFLAIQVFVPSFYELPTALRIKPDNGRWDLVGGYAGVLPLFLTAAGLVVPPWRARPHARASLIFLGAVAAWLLLKNFGVAPFDWIGYLPLFDQVWTPRWGGPTWCFALAAAAAFGLHRLSEAEVQSATRARLAVVAAGVLVLVGALAGTGFATLAPIQETHWSFIWPGAVGGSILALALVSAAAVALGRCTGPTLAFALLGLLLIERWFPIPRGYLPPLLGWRIAPVALGLLAVGLLILGRRIVSGIVAILGLGLALTIDSVAPVGLPGRADPAAEPPVVHFLRERAGHYRLMGDRRVLAPNYASVFGLYDVRYIDALSVEWFHAFVTEALETQPRPWWHALWFIGDPDRRASTTEPGLAASPLEQDLRARLRGYSLLGVRYVVLPSGMDLNLAATAAADRFPVIYDREVRVYENPAALPRAFAVARWESAPHAAAARARVLSADFDPRTSAVIEGGPAGAGATGTVDILEYGATRLRLGVQLAGPSLVVLTDTFYPGWSAMVDGRDARIHRVDGVFRGVFVPEGRHEIAMRFRPPSQLWGLALSAAGIASVIGLAVLPLRSVKPSASVSPTLLQ